MSGAWRIEMLNGFRAIHADGRAIDKFRTQRSALLLAYLAHRPGHFRSREILGEFLWPGEEPETQRSRLRYELSTLRKSLDAALIETGGNRSIRLAPGCESDVALFDTAVRLASVADGLEKRIHHLREAVKLTGEEEPLSHFYDAWALGERRRLSDAILDTLRGLTRDLHAAGQDGEAWHWARVARHRFPEHASEFAAQPPRDIRSRNIPPESVTAVPVPAARSRPYGFVDAFFGRDEECHRIHEWLIRPKSTRKRLLTVTGFGGIGKTRLAAEAFRSVPSDAAAWFIRLELAQTADQFWEALRDGLPLPQPASSHAAAKILVTEWLQKQIFPLLLLDNFEQLIVAGVAAELAHLMTAVPDLRCLTTSRQRLEIAGEQELCVGGLPTPQAMRLFIARSREARGLGAPPLRAMATVEAICRSLEGIPLAVELAAARSRTLSPAQILKQLEDRFGFLVGRRRDGAMRHQTLRATLDWSADLLPSDIRRFWARLSLFQGSFTLSAAEAIAAEAVSVSAIDALESLRMHSLLEVRFPPSDLDRGDDLGAGEARYFLLETVREYAALLIGSDERDKARQRYLHFYLELSKRAAAEVVGPAPSAAIACIERDYGNLRNALRHYAERENASDDNLLRLVQALRWFWVRRGHAEEERYWLEYVFEYVKRTGIEVEPCLYANLLQALAFSLFDRDDSARVPSLLRQVCAIYHAIGDAEGEANAYNALGTFSFRRGDYRAATVAFEESIALTPPDATFSSVGVALQFLGAMRNLWGEYEAAERLLCRARRIYEGAVGGGSIGQAAGILASLALLAWNRSDLTQAESLLTESLCLRRAQIYQSGEASCLTSLGAIASMRGDTVAALRLHNDALALIDSDFDLRTASLILANRGIAHLRSGGYRSAEHDLSRALDLRRAIGDRPGAAQCLEYQADLLCLAYVRYPDAVALWGEASLIRAELGAPLPLVERPWRDLRHADAATALGSDAFDRLWFDAIAARAS